jgi:hypothetical protein
MVFREEIMMKQIARIVVSFLIIFTIGFAVGFALNQYHNIDDDNQLNTDVISKK